MGRQLLRQLPLTYSSEMSFLPFGAFQLNLQGKNINNFIYQI